MTDLSSSRFDPLGRFTGLAGDYARYRPEYPETAVAFIMTRAALTSQAVVVDVGAGTGISSRLFALRGPTVLGIEPNDDMRRRAEAEPFAGVRPPTYRAGRAEATGLSDGVADLVLSAQSFHWFEPATALAEFRRILKTDGWVALMWYERDDGDEATAAVSEAFAALPDSARVEGPRQQAGAALLSNPLFEAGEQQSFGHAQRLDRDGLLGRAFSASYAPREPRAAAAFAAALHDVFDRYQQDGFFTLCYRTTVYMARRRRQP